MSGLIGFFRSFVGTTPSSSLAAATARNETQPGARNGSKDGGDEGLATSLARNESKDSDDEYRLSLSSILSSVATTTTSTREEESQQIQHEYENKGKDEMNETDADQDNEEEIRNPLTYKVWKDARNEIIADYMSKRMAAPDEEEEEEVEENHKNGKDKAVNGTGGEKSQNNNEQEATSEQEDDEVPDNDAIDVPFWDSQPPPSPDKEHQASKSSDADGEGRMENNNTKDLKDEAVNNSIPKVPHVDDTTHTCTSIHTIDLHAKEIEFDLLKVEKIWGLRRTGRRNGMDRSYRCRNGTTKTLGFLKNDCNGGIDQEDQEEDHTDQVLPLIPFKEFEEDGPLGTLCKQVISMEVTQLILPTQKTLQQKASAAFSVGCCDDGQQKQQKELEEDDDPQLRVQQRYRKQRLRIFFYADYATQISAFLQRSNAYNTRSTSNITADLLLSLKAMPAKCILPFQIYPSSTSLSWYDQTNLSEYCICVADTTNMKMVLSESFGSNTYEGQLTRVRFDTPDSKIELALVRGGEETATTTTTSAKQQHDSHAIMLTMDTLDEGHGRSSISAKSTDDNSECRLKEVYEEWQQKYKRQQKEEQAAAAMKESPIRMEEKKQQIINQKESSTNQKESIQMDITDTVGATATRENTTTSVPPSAYQNSEHDVSEIETTAVAAAASASLHSDNDTFDNATTSEMNEQRVQQEVGNRGDDDGDNGGDKMSSMSSKRSPPSSTNNETSSSAISTTNAKRRKTAKTAIEYLKLTELGSIVTEKGKTAAAVNIFGVVLGFGCPRFTRSGDWMMTVWVVDESIPLPRSGANSEGTNVNPAHDHSIPSVSINIFVKERSQLPNLLVAGDILRCHRLGVQMWNDEIQCLGRRNSSFVVIRPKANVIPDEIEAASEAIQEDAWSVIPTATQSFTFDQEDLSRATVLWRWGQTRLLQHPTIKVSTKFRLADMKRQWETDSAEEAIEHGDLTVMVAAKIQVPNEMRTGVTPRGYLRVWDGTGPPQSDPLPIGTGAAHDSVTNGDPPSEALASIASAIRAINGTVAIEDRAKLAQSEIFELEPPKAVCGRVVNVAVWEDPSWDLVDASVRIGAFIRLRNVEDRTMASGFRCLMAYNRSSLTPLPEKTFEIRTLLKEHQMRIRQKQPFNRRSGLLPLQSEGRPTNSSKGVNGGITSPVRDPKFNTTSHVSRQGNSTLAHCIAESAGQAFSVNFQITKTEPSVTGSEIGLRRLCAQTNGAGNSAAVESFQFALHIADDTAKLAVIVDNEIGECLLGMTASDASNSSDLATDMLDVITRRDASWSGTVRSVMFRGFKYFTLESVSSFPINHSSW